MGCVNVQEPTFPQMQGAKWCANKGGSCTAKGGDAHVWYGAGLSWRIMSLDDGDTIKCTNNGFGCNPAPGFSKRYCFKYQYKDKLPSSDPFPRYSSIAPPVVDPTSVTNPYAGAVEIAIIVSLLLNVIFMLWCCIRRCRRRCRKKREYKVVTYDTETDVDDKE